MSKWSEFWEKFKNPERAADEKAAKKKQAEENQKMADALKHAEEEAEKRKNRTGKQID